MRLDHPFRGSAAVAAALVTKKTLRGPRMRRLFPDTYVDAEVDDTLPLRARAALVCRPAGVLRGTTAAVLWAPPGTVDRPGPVQLVAPGVGGRSVDGLQVVREQVDPEDVVEIDGEFGPLRLTTPARTIVDVARDADLSLTEAVVVADALASQHGVRPAEVRVVAARHTGARGIARVPAVLGRTDRRSTSPRRTRVRLALREAGLPRPEVDPWITDTAEELVGAVDLAWREERVGLQIDRPWDEAVVRGGDLVLLGWRLQYVPDDDPLDEIVARARTLIARARDRRRFRRARAEWRAAQRGQRQNG